ncbi:polar amino acid transport system substrate-binding protein [Maridesulfovibrio ferrireducens]|uniref:Polar amino acid transport system substrate-binding protein n=1 Tax=Maridesulfovibrio ferrireducens TaxID=246191 RepID=A0A1G9FPP0_9BACT|nr:transporter substrate-binding domain-containing protein [Maridesulfovibrio ferrireducens]SDK90339.1 polar amino acid transport system substrate-binding protein [Maridesulfovibrio ferrireducens]
MNKLITALFLAILFISAPAYAGQELLLATDSFPPYYYEKDGKPHGLYCDLVALTFEQMNIAIKLSFVPWKRALFMAKNNISNGIMGILKTEERKKWLIYAEEPISKTQIVIFHRKGENFQYKDLDSLKGKRIGIVKGYSYGDAFTKSNIFSREEVSSLNLNFRKLLAGRIDLVAGFKAVGIHTLNKMNLSDKISFSHTPVHQSSLYLAFGLKPGNKALAIEFSRILRKIKKSPACIEAMKRADLPPDTISPCN